MKKLISIILTVLLVLAVCPSAAGAETKETAEEMAERMGSSGISPMTGTFIQPWLYSGWSDARWEQEIAEWKLMGIEYLIVGDTFEITLDENNGYAVTHMSASYPTNIEGASRGNDYLTKLYEMCSKHNIKLFIGMGNTTNGWPYIDLDKEEDVEVFKRVCAVFAAVAEDIYNIYYEDHSDIFAGFYFVPELYNNSAFSNAGTRTAFVNGFAEGLNAVFDKLNSLNPDLPFIFSPYVNIFGGSWVCKDFDAISAFWSEALATAGFRDGDILSPQDSCGAGGMSLEYLDQMTAAYRNAVDSCGKDIQLWSNCELFVQPPNEFLYNEDGLDRWGTATLDRITQQFEIVCKYVDRLITFAYPHYLSSYYCANGFYNSYMYYLENGELEHNAPTAPDTFRTAKTTVNGKSVLYVTFGGMYDDFGIARVNVYKNGEFFTYRVAEMGSAKTTNLYPNAFFDSSYDFNTKETVTYEIEVIDCSGNVSERTRCVVEPGSVPNNVKVNIYSGPETVRDESKDDNGADEDISTEASAPAKSGGLSLPQILVLAGAGIVLAGAAVFSVKSRKKKK